MTSCIDVRITGGDDTAAIQAALDSYAPCICLPDTDREYGISDSLIIDHPIVMCGRGTLKMETDNTPMFIVKDGVNRVDFEDLEMVGPRGTFTRGGDMERAIWFDGKRNFPIEQVRISGCRFSRWGKYDIRADFCNGLTIEECHHNECGYGSIFLVSCLSGKVRSNRITDVFGGRDGFSDLAYGIALTRTDSPDLEAFPRCSDFTIEKNSIDGVESWEAIDGHGAKRTEVVGNYISRCKAGIVFGRGPISKVSVLDIAIRKNTLSGLGWSGISIDSLAGLPGGGVTEYASGCEIVENTIEGFGNPANPNAGAIYVYGTLGLKMTDNQIYWPSPSGVFPFHDNVAMEIARTFIVDPGTNVLAVGFGYGVNVADRRNSGRIEGTRMVRSNRQAQHVCTLAVRVVAGNPGLVW